ncbi:MAG: patatin-like phospholipase family protein [Alphaproteobacteria bacterium]|nr:patatin-like phospholipase family protein [Alphaproteobacteria bacterium]
MSDLRIGLALGGGAARGIAHIPMIEAFDELGLKPTRIAGTSFGALVGAGYASGLTGKEIREHTISVLGNRIDAARRLFSNPDTNVWELFDVKSFNKVLIEGSTLANLILPKKTASEVNKTKIPLTIIATDLTVQEEVAITSGDLREAVAASMALPGLIQAPKLKGRTLVDGAMSNPVPFEHVADGTDLIVAIDVTGGRLSEEDNEAASNLTRAFRSIYVMQHQIIKLRREKVNPEIYIYPDVDEFRAGEFFKVRDIMAAAKPAKEELKRALEAAIKAHGG